MTTWDATWLGVATVISQRSKDPNTKVGAVLVSPDNREMAVGYNGLPPGVDDDIAFLSRQRLLLDKFSKDDLVIHAEVNAIINCRVRPEGWTLYLTHLPCIRCASVILGAGIVRVVSRGWKTTTEKHHRGDEAVDFLRWHGVEVVV